MRIVIQKVNHASVTVGDELVSSIGPGFMVLVGSEEGDGDADVKFIAGKIAGMRIFEDADDKLNLSIKDVGGEVLLVSQFTLLGDAQGKAAQLFTCGDAGYRRAAGGKAARRTCCRGHTYQNGPVPHSHEGAAGKRRAYHDIA